MRRALVLTAVVGALVAAPETAWAHGGGFFSAPSGTAPTIDGTIGAGEWADAAAYSLTFGSLPATVRFKEDGTNLYVGVTVQDPSPGPSPRVSISFDNNHDGLNNTGDDDWLAFPTFGSDFFYNPTGTGGAGFYNDLTAAGTDDTAAAASSAAGQVSFEMAHPLCSSDTSHDICASQGQILGVDFQYEPDTAPGVFYNAPGPDLFGPSNNWADLAINPDTTPPSVTLTQPDAGAILRGKVRVAANASDNVGVARVDFIYRGRLTPGGPLVDNLIGSATNGGPGAPYFLTFDTTQFPNTLIKDATIFARAYDTANNSTLSVGNAVTIDNTAPGRIVFESDRDGNSEIWSMDPDGTNLKQVTHTDPPVVNTRPSLSPDGHTIVFERTINGETQIYSTKYDGTNERQLTTSAQGNNGAPAFSPDGTKIAFHSDRATEKRQIYVMNADGSNQTRVTNDSGIDADPSWNNSGTKLAFDSDQSGNFDIWTVNSDGSSPVDLTPNYASRDTDPDWSPDGQTILFVSDRGGTTSVWKMNADGTAPDDLTDASIYDADVAWAPDGQHLAFVRDAGGQDFNVWTARPNDEFGGPNKDVNFGNAQLRLTDVCIGYTVSDQPSKTYAIQSPPSSANCNITQDRSISGDTPTSITFNNVSGRTVDVFWLDYQGNRVYYNTLAPGQGYTQQTFLTHPWVIIAHGPWRNSFPDWGPRPLPAPQATNLSVTATPSSSTAGAPQVKLANVPPLALILPQAGLQSAPVNQSPVNQSPVNQTPVNQLATTTAPVNQTPINQSPVNQTPVNQSGFAELTQSISQLGSITISTIPLIPPDSWADVLSGTPLAGIPEQSVTLQQVYALNPLPQRLQPNATNPLTIGDLDLSRSPLGTIPAIAFTLGKLPLSQIATATGTFTDWCTSANVPGVDCTGSQSSPATVLSTSIQGAPVNQSPVNQTPVNQTLIQALAADGTPVNQTPVNQTPINQSQIGALPVNQTPVNQTPVNQLSLQPILAANAPVNQSPVNQTPVNQLSNPNDLFSCSPPNPSGPNTIDCSTATLKDAVNAVRPGVTLGDLRSHAPATLLASWTIADLRDYGNMTIGDLLLSLPQPNSFTLADVLLLVLGSPAGVQGLSFEGINIFDTGLQQVATGGPTVAYQAQFTVSPNGGPSGIANTVAVSSTIGTNFLYVPGSSTLAQGTSCSPATAVNDPSKTRLADGRLKLTWSVPTIVGNTYSICFTARPGLVLGPQAASLDAQPADGSTASAIPTSVDIGDTLESNDTASTSPLISDDSFYLSYLTSASDVDYYRFPAPPAGTLMTFHLSHLPADYDLVVYGPPETALRPPLTSGAVPLDEPPVTDNGVALTSSSDALPSQTLDDLNLQPSMSMVGVSASRGTDPEDVVVTSQGTGFYTVQVTGYNGATSPDPYMLRVATTPPRTVSNVPPRTITGSVGPALPPLPTGLNTVFLVNRQQLEGIYGSTRATNVMNAIANDSAAFTALGFPNVILSVDNATNDSPTGAVATAYTHWNAHPGDPAAANGVVQAINGMIDSKIRSQPNGAGLKYLVIVGGDQIIPFARLDDFTVTAANEANYASTFAANTDLAASLGLGMMLSDDPYGDINPVPYLNRQLYIPELSVGRLVETPEDIIGTLDRFVSPSVQGHLDPSTSLTTGYDFLFDGASRVNDFMSARLGAANASTLLDNPAIPAHPTDAGDSWTLAQLVGAFLPTTGSAPSITSLNGHASHYQFQPPANDKTGAPEPLFTTSAVTASGTASLTNRLVFSMGCHAGLSVADATVTAGGASTLDWPQAFAQKGLGAFLGNTGYGYGDSIVVAYSEELNRLFAQNIAAGAKVGNAVVAAKQAYYGELGVFGVYDEKAMAEFTLYGLPMWGVANATGGTGAAAALAASDTTTAAPAATATPAADPSVAGPDPLVTDPTTGLQAETFSVDPTSTPHPNPPSGPTYWSGPDGVQVTHLRPIQPKTIVGLSGTTAHGALITELTSTDTNCITPVFDRPVFDLSANEPAYHFADVAFPSKLQTVRTFETPTGRQQQLVLVNGQFFTQHCTTNPDPQVGVQRLFGHIAGRVFRSTNADYIPPAFQMISATQVGGTAAFSVDVTDKTPSTDSVKQVLVGLRSGTDTTWTFVNLTQSATNPTRWTGGAPVTGTNQFEYFVQAVDQNGNVAVSTNKGFYFVGAPAPQPPPDDLHAHLTGTTTNGWFTAAAGLSLSPPPGVTVQVSVDGGAYGPPPSTISGDGVHVIAIRASNGETGTLIAPIDTTAPTIVINTPAAGAQYVLNSAVKADYFCQDAGSGVVSCPTSPSVPFGANIDTSSLGQKTFTVGPVTDRAGHTAPAKTVTYTVVLRRKILFSSARTGGGDIYAMNPDGTGLTVVAPNSALDEQPAWSPDGSKIAFASGRGDKKGSLDIYVMDANGQNVQRLTTAPGDDTAPAWSSDGAKIAFQSQRDGNIEIYVMNNDGTNQQRLTNTPNQDLHPAWSPDGKKIAFASNRSGGPNIWLMDANGANPKRLTTSTQPEDDPAWSIDGSRLTFDSKRGGGAAQIYTMDPFATNPESTLVRLTTSKGGDTEPIYSRDGLKIAFTSVRDGNMEIYIMSANGSSQTRLTTNAAVDHQPDW